MNKLGKLFCVVSLALMLSACATCGSSDGGSSCVSTCGGCGCSGGCGTYSY